MEYDENASEPIVAPDTDNRCIFHPEEARDIPKESWQYQARLKNRNVGSLTREFEIFRRMNTGRGDRRKTSGDKSLEQYMDRVQRFDSISSHLEMTDYQKRFGRNLRNSLKLRNMGYKDEYVSFCLCVFVCRYGRYARRTSESERTLYHPDRNSGNNDQRFVELAESIGLERRIIRKCMGKMAQNLPKSLSWD